MAFAFAETENEREDALQHRYMVFGIDNESFAIEIRHIMEIIVMQPIAAVPEVPDYIRGVINFRNKAVSVIDLRVKFKKEIKPYTARTCIMVMHMFDMVIGLIVDAVDEVLYIEEDKILPPPTYQSGMLNRYVKGVYTTLDKTVLLLYCENLFKDEEWELLKKSNKGGEKYAFFKKL